LNFMVRTADGSVVLCDFGLARLEGGSSQGHAVLTDHPEAGTYDYMAPEQRQRQPCTFKVDVFAFGVMLPFLFTGEAWKAEQRYARPPIVPRIPAASASVQGRMAELTRRCVAEDPQKRPDFDEVLRVLQGIQLVILSVGALNQKLCTCKLVT